MSPEVLSVITLALMFLFATWRGVNMGVLGFVAAAVLGSVALGMEPGDYLAGFPVDLLVTLLGLTFLFGFAKEDGSIDIIVRAALRMVGGHRAAAPWVFFALTAALIAIGALFAVAIVAPLALRFARTYRLNILMTGLMVVHGALAGAFSPISVYGLFITGFLEERGLATAEVPVFLGSFVVNLVLAAIVFAVMHRRLGLAADLDDVPGAATTAAGSGAARSGAAGLTSAATTAPDTHRISGAQALTLVGLAVLVLGTVAFGLHIGILGLAIGAVLGILNPANARTAMGSVSWSVIVLISGVLTYIAVLEEAGTVEWVSGGIGAIGIPLLAALLLFYLAGVVSALASSLGIIGVVLALAVPFLQSGDVHVAGFMAGLAVAATVVDISPFSTNGAMLLANVDDSIRERFYRQMLAYAGLMVAFGPAISWLLVAIPTWMG